MIQYSPSGHMPHLELMRGFAILFVVLFHFHQPYFCNGFYGVEIFLVISGFLLLNSHVRKGAPSPGGFLCRKVFRIYPSLAAVVLICSALSLFFVPDSRELLDSFRTGCHALIAHSNVMLDKNTDYFAPSAATNPLLHTWYISVTIQVFILYIIVATVTKRLPSSVCGAGLVILALLSLCDAYSLRLLPWVHRWDANAAYYSVFSRLWEFIAGGIVLLLPDIPSVRVRKFGSFICLFLLFVIVCVPSYYSISLSPLVILLTVFIIRYADISFYHKAVSAPLIWLGKISFSVYLIHYPLIVFADNWCYRQMGGVSYLCCSVAIVLCGYACWYMIEKRAFPIRVIIPFVCASFAFCAGGVKYERIREWVPESLAAYPQYLPQDAPVAASFYEHLNARTVSKDKGLMAVLANQRSGDCQLLMPMGNSTLEPSFVLIGDSNAQHLYAGMDAALRESSLSGIFLCSRLYPLWGGAAADNACDEAKVRDFFCWLEHQPKLKTVVISQLWMSRFNDELIDWQSGTHSRAFAESAQAFILFCEEIRKRGKEIVLIAPVPQLHDKDRLNPLAYKRMAKIKGDATVPSCYLMSRTVYQEYNAPILKLFDEMQQQGKVCVLSAEEAFFESGDAFSAIDVATGEILLRDPTHLSPPGSIRFMKKIYPELLHALHG